MLSTVMMHLNREFLARLNGDAFDLITSAFINQIVFHPWAVYFPMETIFRSPAILEDAHQKLYVLHQIFVSNQYRAFGLHNH